MKKNKLVNKMKKTAKDVRIVKDGAIREEVECAIQAILNRHPEEKFFFQSRAIKNDSNFYYSVCLPVSKKDFKREFFNYWYYIINEISAMQIKVGNDDILIIKECLI